MRACSNANAANSETGINNKTCYFVKFNLFVNIFIPLPSALPLFPS